MKYAELRRKIKTGDLLAWDGEHNGDLRHDAEVEVVQSVTQDRWSHVGVAWVEHGRVFVMDLTTKGCAPRPLSGDLPRAWIPAPRKLSEAALQRAFEGFGHLEYSKLVAIAAGLSKVIPWLRGWVLRQTKGQCTTYVKGIYAVDGLDPDCLATPGDLVDGAMRAWPGASLTYILED